MRSEPGSASVTTPFGIPDPDGTLVREVALDGMAVDRPVQYALHAVRRGPSLLLRATCLACGASASESVPADDAAFIDLDPERPAGDDDPVTAWGESFASAHDAGACLPNADSADVAIAATIELLADQRLGSGADAFLDANHQLATVSVHAPDAPNAPPAEFRDTVVIVATESGTAVYPAERAALTLAHLPAGGPDLAAHSRSLVQGVGAAPTGRTASAVAFAIDPTSPTVRRWILTLPDRVLAFETHAASTDDVDLAAGTSDFVASTPGVVLDPMRVQAAIALTQRG